MIDREAFEKWCIGRNPIAKMDRHGDGYLYASVNQAWSAWQACANHYESERNALLAVIAEKDKALNLLMTNFGMDEDEWNKPVFDSGRKALALTPENVRLVEVKNIELIDGWPTLVSEKSESGTKLYAIEV